MSAGRSVERNVLSIISEMNPGDGNPPSGIFNTGTDIASNTQ